jgi:LysR family transcriptional regulator, hydrogen peroxide-inducible genes activator
MEMHQIRYFLAVADQLNFTKAAERCNVSQPSLTRAIKLLEDELGGPLFHRERANTHLSELGKMVKPHLQQIYDESHQAKRLAQDFAGLKKSTLKLGIMCTIAPDQIIDLIGSIQRHHHGVELQLGDANAWELQERLIEGALEVAIYCIPGQEPDVRLHIMPLFREQIMIAINPAHRLAKQQSIRVKDLDGECYIHRMNCEFAGHADKAFQEQHVTCKPVYWSDRDDWTLAMIASGLGWGFMPEHLVKPPGVVGIPITEPEFWREVNLATVRGRPHSPAVGALVREAMRIKWFGKPALGSRPVEPSQRADASTLAAGGSADMAAI